MTDAQPPTTPVSGPVPTRIGNTERKQAMDALDVHMSAGRLDPDEYGERVGRASVARTTAELEPLFADLPAPHATGAAAPAADATGRADVWVPGPGRIPLPPVGPRNRRDRRKHGGREPLGGRVGEVAVGLSPFIAVGLFFATTSFFPLAWLFFLLIPIVGVVVYGRDDDDK